MKSLKNLFLAPSKKNPLVKRWQKLIADDAPIEKVLYDAFDEGQVHKIPENPFMDYEPFRRIVEMNTRLGDIQENVKSSYLVVAGRDHPFYELNPEDTPTPFVYSDGSGRSAIITTDNVRRDFPFILSPGIGFSELDAPIEPLIATHELAHVWDMGMLGREVPNLADGDRLLSNIILKDSMGFAGGRAPQLEGEDELIEMAPMLKYMAMHPIEVPAVLTEVAETNQDAFRAVVDKNPWVEKFMNMFYGNSYGTRAYGPRGDK